MESLKDTIIYKLLFVQKKLVSAVREDFSDTGITHEDYVVLHYIYEFPGITQSELSEASYKDKNVIVKCLDRLEKFGFAERIRLKDDRRSFHLHVTEEGKVAVGKYWERLVQRQNNALGDLTEEEVKNLHAILDKIINKSFLED